MKPLLYKPPPRWHIWAFVGGAIAIHVGSVVIAGLNREPPPVDLSNIPTAEITATLEAQEAPTPPPEDIPLPPPPPEPQVQPEFHEEQATPPPRTAARPANSPELVVMVPEPPTMGTPSTYTAFPVTLASNTAVGWKVTLLGTSLNSVAPLSV